MPQLAHRGKSHTVGVLPYIDSGRGTGSAFARAGMILNRSLSNQKKAD